MKPVELLAVASAMAVVVLFGSPSTATAEPTLKVTPSSGPCNGAVTATGTGFPPGASVLFQLGGGGHKVLANLSTVAANTDGTLQAHLQFPDSVCEFPYETYGVWANQADGLDDLSIYTRTEYQLTAEVLPAAGTGPRFADTSVLPLALLAFGGTALVLANHIRRRSGA